ncbi:hypothetical protein FRB95_009998 [Tulasnella sp. JGI-2019a]|nr:hypothetical protein FRB95_009998 [Tulasnella sp. JGI-2019a]
MAQVAPSPRPPSRTSSIRSPSPLARRESHRASTATSTTAASNRSSRQFDASQIPQSPQSTRHELDMTSPTRPSRSSRRKSSYETLTQISANKDSSLDSYIPLPARTFSAPDTSIEAIREGVPLEINIKNHDRSSPTADGRPVTPSRTISRIPIAAVGNARALAEDGRPRSISPLPLTPSANGETTPGDTSLDFAANMSSGSLLPSTPTGSNAYKRLSMGPGGTSKVLSDLQTAAVQSRTALDNTRAQLRLSQRSVGSLTRQVEDLKDGRERLRLENENLNNVVARKERLLQEVLERARKAEAEVIKLRTDLKTEVTTAKKASATVQDAVTLKDKAENEYKVLRDSIAAMKQGWKDEVKHLKDEMRKKDDAWKEEVKEIEVKYGSLLKLTRASNAERKRMDSMKTEIVTLDNQFETHIRSELTRLAKDIQKSTEDTEGANRKTVDVAEELARLKRLMRTAGSTSRHEGG